VRAIKFRLRHIVTRFVHDDVLEGVKAKEAEGEKRRNPAHRVGHFEGKTGRTGGRARGIPNKGSSTLYAAGAPLAGRLAWRDARMPEFSLLVSVPLRMVVPPLVRDRAIAIYETI